jgi:hypothetical protein
VSYAGFVNGESPAVLSGTLSCTTTATVFSPGGSYPITCSGQASSFYTISYVPGTLTILPALLGVSADSKTKVYGAAVPPLTVSYSGFVLGQDPSVLGGAVVVSSAVNASSTVGTYPISLSSTLTSTNYSISIFDGSLSVIPAPLTVVANNKTKAFGAALPTFTASYAGFVLGQNQSALGGTLSFNTSATATSAPGDYPVVPSGFGSANYQITYVPGNLKIIGKGVIDTYAGGGPNNVPALSAAISNPWSLARDAGGNLYVAASGDHRILKIDLAANVSVFAGNGVGTFSGDGGAATRASLKFPQALHSIRVETSTFRIQTTIAFVKWIRVA